MNKNNKSYGKVPLEVSVQIHVLHHECGYGIAKLQKRFQASPRMTAYRHMRKANGNTDTDERKSNPGVPRKLKKKSDKS